MIQTAMYSAIRAKFDALAKIKTACVHKASEQRRLILELLKMSAANRR